MATCNYCEREMTTAQGCTLEAFEIDGEVLDRLRYAEEGFELEDPSLVLPDRCHDCGCERGHFHHVSCDMELCPKCHRQALSCPHELLVPEPFAHYDDENDRAFIGLSVRDVDGTIELAEGIELHVADDGGPVAFVVEDAADFFEIFAESVARKLIRESPEFRQRLRQALSEAEN